MFIELAQGCSYFNLQTTYLITSRQPKRVHKGVPI